MLQVENACVEIVDVEPFGGRGEEQVERLPSQLQRRGAVARLERVGFDGEQHAHQVGALAIEPPGGRQRGEQLVAAEPSDQSSAAPQPLVVGGVELLHQLREGALVALTEQVAEHLSDLLDGALDVVVAEGHYEA